MSYKICPKCIGSTNYMTGTITQAFDPSTEDPQITEFICPYCGYTETETIAAPATMGIYNPPVGRLMTPIILNDIWGIYNSGIGYKMEPVSDPLNTIILASASANSTSEFSSDLDVIVV